MKHRFFLFILLIPCSKSNYYKKSYLLLHLVIHISFCIPYNGSFLLPRDKQRKVTPFPTD